MVGSQVDPEHGPAEDERSIGTPATRQDAAGVSQSDPVSEVLVPRSSRDSVRHTAPLRSVISADVLPHRIPGSRPRRQRAIAGRTCNLAVGRQTGWPWRDRPPAIGIALTSKLRPGHLMNVMSLTRLFLGLSNDM